MKRDLIITLYKGSYKYDDCPKNYRGISLLPVIDKLFDKVLPYRINERVHSECIEFLSANENVYQQNLCGLFASFALHQCVNHNIEKGSETYVRLLDSSSAFDTVCHAGMFPKLYELGIVGKTKRLSRNYYNSVVSNVVLKGMTSGDISIKQFVKQGSILGPWLYLLYVHELAMQLLNHSVGM